MATAEAQQEKADIKIETHVSNKATHLVQKLKRDQVTQQKALMDSAAKALGSDVPSQITTPQHEELDESNDLGESSSIEDNSPALGYNAQMKLAAQLSEARTGLKLKMSRFQTLRTRETALIAQATQLAKATSDAQAREYDAQTRTDAMQHAAERLGRLIGHNEEKMKLSETLFKEETKDEDLGESSSPSKPVPPIQAEINDEQQKLAEANAELSQMAKDGSRLYNMQIANDKKMLGKKLKEQDTKLNKLHQRFVHAAAGLSPTIKSQNALNAAVEDEKDTEHDYRKKLDDIAAYANMVDAKAKEAADATFSVN